MNILVVTSYFGPETSVGVLRVNAFVKHWAKSGHTVDVVTMPFFGESPEGIRNNPKVRIFQIAPMLIGGRQSSDSQGYAKGATGWKRKIVAFQYWLKRRLLCNYLDPRVLWWPKVAAFICNNLTKSVRYDFMFSTVPSYTAHSAAACVKFFDKELLWVADYRDLWSGNPIFPGCSAVRFIEKTHERWILRSANLIVSINQPLVDELRALHGGERYSIVPNGFDDETLTAGETCAPTAANNPKVVIVYAGSILPGLQDPSPLFRAIKELADDASLAEGDLEVRFYGDYSVLDSFPLASDNSVQKFVARCGKVPRKDILTIQRDADFLLFLGSKPVVDGVGSTTGVVSGKIFEYLVSGTEILAVRVTSDMIAAEMITKARAGDYYGDDVEKIKRRILLAVRGGGTSKVSPDLEYLDQFRRCRQAQKIIEDVARISGHAPKHG